MARRCTRQRRPRGSHRKSELARLGWRILQTSLRSSIAKRLQRDEEIHSLLKRGQRPARQLLHPPDAITQRVHVQMKTGGDALPVTPLAPKRVQGIEELRRPLPVLPTAPPER